MDLELVETDKLVEELMRRSHHFVLGMVCVDGGPSGDTIIRRHHVGNSHVCLGLLTDLSDVMLRQFRSCARPYENWG